MFQRDLPVKPDDLRVAAVVVTFNRLEQLRQTVARLLTEQIEHLIGVDHGSADGTGAWLAQAADPRMTVITSAQNCGGAGGFEIGMRAAVAEFDPDWLVLMDDDARPEPGVIAQFRGMDHQGFDGVAAAVYTLDGGICDMNRPSVNPFWHPAAFLQTLMGQGRSGFHLKDQDYQATGAQAIDAASFVGLFLSRAGIRAAGFPDGRLFIYGDDVLYTLAMRRAGCKLAFVPDLRFEHDFTTFEAGSIVFRPLWKAYYHHRNLLFVYRSAAGVLFWPVLLLVLPKWLLKGGKYGADRPGFMRLLRLAIRDGLVGRRNRAHAEILAVEAKSD